MMTFKKILPTLLHNFYSFDNEDDDGDDHGDNDGDDDDDDNQKIPLLLLH